MPNIAIHSKLSVTLSGFIIDLYLASVTSKNCWQQEVFPSATKPSDTGAINSAKGIVAKLGRAEGMQIKCPSSKYVDTSFTYGIYYFGGSMYLCSLPIMTSCLLQLFGRLFSQTGKDGLCDIGWKVIRHFTFDFSNGAFNIINKVFVVGYSFIYRVL